MLGTCIINKCVLNNKCAMQEEVDTGNYRVRSDTAQAWDISRIMLMPNLITNLLYHLVILNTVKLS